MLKAFKNSFKKKIAPEPKILNHVVYANGATVENTLTGKGWKGLPYQGVYDTKSNDGGIFHGTGLFEYLIWSLQTHFNVRCMDGVPSEGRMVYIFNAMNARLYEVKQWELQAKLNDAEKQMKAALEELRKGDVEHTEQVYGKNSGYLMKTQMFIPIKGLDGGFTGDYLGSMLNPNLLSFIWEVRNEILDNMGIEY
jgi:hypothetical protein